MSVCVSVCVDGWLGVCVNLHTHDNPHSASLFPTTGISESALELVDQCGGLLIAGTSLTTYSSYRLAKHAEEKHVPICVVNIGPTRADEAAHVRLERRLGVLLPRAVERLRMLA